MRTRKSWHAKLADSKDLPKVEPLTGPMSARWGKGTILIPAPLEVDRIMKKIPRGKLITVNEIREALARAHGATLTCPLTTGIFARIAACAAEEDEAAGKKRCTRYWRTLKTGGEVNPKFPGGVEALGARLRAEGHKLVRRGQRTFVLDYERRLAKL